VQAAQQPEPPKKAPVVVAAAESASIINLGNTAPVTANTSTSNLASTKASSASQDLFDAFQSAPTQPTATTAAKPNAPLVSDNLKANILSLYSSPPANQLSSPTVPVAFGQVRGLYTFVKALKLTVNL
jgi:hypothetical protein